MYRSHTANEADPSALTALQSEISAMQSLEAQLVQDIHSMEQRKRTLELSGTLKGKFLALIGYLFTWYCVARVVLSAISLLFGLDREANQKMDDVDGDTRPPQNVLSSLLGAVVSVVGLNVDVATWSRLVSLALIGVIILVNMRVVLSSIYRVSNFLHGRLTSSFACCESLRALILFSSWP